MNTTKRTRRVILFLSFLMLTSVAAAQRNQGPPQPPSGQQLEEMVNQLSRELDLTNPQTAQITVLFRNHFDEMKSKMGQNASSKRPDPKVMETQRAAFENQVKALLSPEQVAAFETFMEKRSPVKPDRRYRHQ